MRTRLSPRALSSGTPPDSLIPALAHRRLLLGLSALSALVVCLLAALSIGVFLRIPDPPTLVAQPVSAPRLAKRLVVVLIDGLRHDYATDPEKMPHFAARMSEETSATLWAGHVTMTSAAILSLGTGERGDFAQILTNVDAGRVRVDDLFTEARTHGFRTALIGDETWRKVYGPFDIERAHIHELAMGIDNSAETFAAASEVLTAKDAPELTIAHFVAADHVGHAVTATSARYLEVLRGVDELLHALLAKLPADVTVVALSDHGMRATGAHGADTEIERKCPMFAYGPGIRRGVKLGAIHQIDLASTFAALLGVPSPAHGRGAAIVDMLDVDPPTAARIQCADAARATALGQALGVPTFMPESCRAVADPERTIDEARRVVERVDHRLQRSQFRAVGFAEIASFALLMALLFGAATLARRHAPALPGVVALVTPALLVAFGMVVLVVNVERITPPWHNVARGAVYAAFVLCGAAAAIRPRSLRPMLDRRAPVTLALFPIALAWSFPDRAQLVAWLTIAVIYGVLAWRSKEGPEDLASTEGKSDARSRRRVGLAVGALAMALLWPTARYVESPIPDELGARPGWLLGSVIAAVTLWLVARSFAYEERGRAPTIAAAIALATTSFLARSHVPGALGVTLVVLYAVASFVAATRAQSTLALALGFGAYAWLARDVELPFVLGAAMAADAMGLLLPTHLRGGRAHPSKDGHTLVLVVALGFSAAFLARIGVQAGVDFTAIDFGAGSFGDVSVAPSRTAVLCIVKYFAAASFVGRAMLMPLGKDAQRIVAGASAVLWAGRSAAIVRSLFAARSSYFTASRALGDVPTALIQALAWSALGAALAYRARSDESGLISGFSEEDATQGRDEPRAA